MLASYVGELSMRVTEHLEWEEAGCGGQEGGPGHGPDDEHEQEEPDGGLAVVVGDSFGEEAGDVLVVEIEPGPAAFCGESESCGQGDGWIAEGGEDVPGGGDGEEDRCAGE